MGRLSLIARHIAPNRVIRRPDSQRTTSHFNTKLKSKVHYRELSLLLVDHVDQWLHYHDC